MPTSTNAGSGHSDGRMRRTPGLLSGSCSVRAAAAAFMASTACDRTAATPAGVDEAQLGHLRRDPLQRVAGPPRGLLLLGPVAERGPGERAVLVEEAVDERLDDDRPLAGAQRRQGTLHRQVHGERVHAVDPPGRDAEAERPRRQARLPGGFLDGGGDGVAVVLDEEAQRQLPRGREVEAFQHRADVGRAVAEVRDRDVGRAGMPLRPGVARRHRHAAADDRVGAQRPGLEPLQVHRAAAPGAVALGEPEDLRQRALQHLRHLLCHEGAQVEHALRHVGERLGEELVVAAVRAVDRVGRAQRDDRADRAALLADAGVRGAVHEAFAGQLEDRFLEGADEVQLAQHGGEQRGIGGLPVGRRGGQLVPFRARLKALHAWHGTRLSRSR